MPKESETLKVKIVGPVNTNIDDPWRTQGDYKEYQKLIRASHEKMLKGYRWNIAVSIAVIITAIATVTMAFVAVLKIFSI